jgi:hypothetical protein
LNKPAAILGFLAAAASAISIYLYDQLEDERERNATLGSRIVELEKIPRADLFLPEDALPARAIPADVPSPAPTADKPPSNTVAFSDQVEGRPNNPRARRDTPEMRETMRAQQKMRLMRAYPDLAATLRLRPDEVDKLFDLLTDQQLKTMELRDSLREKNLPREQLANALRERNAMQEAERDKQIAALFGDAKAQEWKTYENSLSARMQVRELGTILESSGMPLRSDQSQSLIDALVVEQNRYRAEQQALDQRDSFNPQDSGQRLALFEQNLAQQEQHFQRSHDAIAPFLSTEQLKRYDEINNQQLENQRRNLERMRERLANGSQNRN